MATVQTPNWAHQGFGPIHLTTSFAEKEASLPLSSRSTYVHVEAGDLSGPEDVDSSGESFGCPDSDTEPEPLDDNSSDNSKPAEPTGLGIAYHPYPTKGASVRDQAPQTSQTEKPTPKDIEEEERIRKIVIEQMRQMPSSPTLSCTNCASPPSPRSFGVRRSTSEPVAAPTAGFGGLKTEKSQPSSDKGRSNVSHASTVRPAEPSAVDQKWGVLFDEEGLPTKRWEQVQHGIAKHLMDEFRPCKTVVLTPEKMASFYSQFRLDDEPLPLLDLFRARGKDTRATYARVEHLYQALKCEYHLLQDETRTRPIVPGLTLAGWTRWMNLTMRANPADEAQRLAHVVVDLPINAESLLDGKLERLPKQLSRHLLPEKADKTVRLLIDESLKAALKVIQLPPEQTKIPMVGTKEQERTVPSSPRSLSPRSRYRSSPSSPQMEDDERKRTDRGGRGRERDRSREREHDRDCDRDRDRKRTKDRDYDSDHDRNIRDKYESNDSRRRESRGSSRPPQAILRSAMAPSRSRSIRRGSSPPPSTFRHSTSGLVGGAGTADGYYVLPRSASDITGPRVAFADKINRHSNRDHRDRTRDRDYEKDSHKIKSRGSRAPSVSIPEKRGGRRRSVPEGPAWRDIIFQR